MDLNVEQRLRRIAINLFLDNFEKEKFLRMYRNSDPVRRDYIIAEIERKSESRNFEVRRMLREKIRSS